ncbi:MAG: hypothetical protein ABJA80_01660 [bacterium]
MTTSTPRRGSKWSGRARWLGLALALPCTVAAQDDAARLAPAGSTAGRRPLVLLVHGLGFPSRDSAEFRRMSLASLRAGAFRATGDSLLRDDDVRLVWYADLMDVRRDNALATPTCRGGTGDDSTFAPTSIVQGIALAASALMDLGAAQSGSVEGREIAGDLRFFGDEGARCAAEGRVANALALARAEGRPVVLVAHSLGALVTWSYLEHREQNTLDELPPILRLVTVGSPVGSGILRELLFGDTTPVSLPRGVRSWANVVHEDDPFASRLLATDSLGGPLLPLPGISDVVSTADDDDPHELRGYLRDEITARTVLGAWCDALESRQRVRGCVALVAPARS